MSVGFFISFSAALVVGHVVNPAITPNGFCQFRDVLCKCHTPNLHDTVGRKTPLHFETESRVSFLFSMLFPDSEVPTSPKILEEGGSRGTRRTQKVHVQL